MVRPRKRRLVGHEPEATYFKPRSIALRDLEEVELSFDELESLRLFNLERLSQKDAADSMGIHQSTFQRTLTEARRKISEALVYGKAIKIDGGVYEMPGGDRTGPIGQGRGFGRKDAAGPGGICKCPKCGHEEEHVRARPCNMTKCPKCGAYMDRA